MSVCCLSRRRSFHSFFGLDVRELEGSIQCGCLVFEETHFLLVAQAGIASLKRKPLCNSEMLKFKFRVSKLRFQHFTANQHITLQQHTVNLSSSGAMPRRVPISISLQRVVSAHHLGVLPPGAVSMRHILMRYLPSARRNPAKNILLFCSPPKRCVARHISGSLMTEPPRITLNPFSFRTSHTGFVWSAAV